MARTKTTETPTLTAAQLADGDWIPMIDVSDTTTSPTGRNVKVAKSQLAEAAGVTAHAAVTSGVHGISAFGATLVDDADAATARSTLGLPSRYVGATVTDGRAVIQQPDYPVDVATKGGYAAVQLLGYEGATANKAPLQLYSAKSSAAGEDVLFSVDYAGNGFPGPITIIKADGGIETGAYLKVSGHAKNGGSSSGYKEATYKRTMATIWTDTPGASETESNCVLSLRNVGAAYPAGDAGNCDVLLIVEDSADDVIANGKERLSIRPKGDIYQMFTTHTTDWYAATNYERAHLGWDVANSRYLVETQAGGTGTRRELLVKDRKFITTSYPGSISATTNLLLWPVPRACVIKSVKFSSLTSLSVSGSAFWRVGVTKYASGSYVGDIVNVGNDSIALSSGQTNDLGTPSATYGVLAAGDVVRVFMNKAVGSPAAIDGASVIIEWEPT